VVFEVCVCEPGALGEGTDGLGSMGLMQAVEANTGVPSCLELTLAHSLLIRSDQTSPLTSYT